LVPGPKAITKEGKTRPAWAATRQQQGPLARLLLPGSTFVGVLTRMPKMHLTRASPMRSWNNSIPGRMSKLNLATLKMNLGALGQMNMGQMNLGPAIRCSPGPP